MTDMSHLLIGTVVFVLLLSVAGSMRAFFKERRKRKFIKAQRQADSLQKRVRLPDPRGK